MLRKRENCVNVPQHDNIGSIILWASLVSSNNTDNLKTARDVIEGLQLVELDNFFREACLTAKPEQVDKVDAKAAVIYPIILKDQLAIITSLPKTGASSDSKDNRDFRYYKTKINKKTVELSHDNSLELLVLSACETAAGDTRSALGLAGVAVRSGARSTIATLWQVNDDASAKLISQFYDELVQANKTGISKAEALRRAQVTILKTPNYKSPYYWAAYVLLGNWT